MPDGWQLVTSPDPGVFGHGDVPPRLAPGVAADGAAPAPQRQPGVLGHSREGVQRVSCRGGAEQSVHSSRQGVGAQAVLFSVIQINNIICASTSPLPLKL